MTQIERVTEPEVVLAAPHLFDGPPRLDATRTFLDAPGHHILMAFDEDDGRAVGMVTGVEMTMPDKGTEMFLYELAVDESVQTRGIGTALARALAEIAEQRGCYDMWVLTDHDNVPALGAYRRSGAGASEPTTMLTWHFRTDDDAPPEPPDIVA